MKLDAENVAGFEHSRVIHSVVARRCSRVIDRRIVTMSKVQVRIVAAYQLRTRSRSNLIPAHVRDPSAGRKTTNHPLEQPQATLFRGFFARLKHRLQPETDPKKRHAGADAIEQCFADTHGIEGAHHLAEVSHARQNDLVGAL